MREKYESLSLVVLRDLAKARGLKNISSMKKSDLVNRMLEEDARKPKRDGEYADAGRARGACESKRGHRAFERSCTAERIFQKKNRICTKGTRNRCRSSDKRKGRRAGRNTGKSDGHLQRQMIP